MKKRLSVLATVFAGLFLVACDVDDDTLSYVNKSDQSIYIYKTYSAEQILPPGEEYLGRVIYPFYKSGRFQSFTEYIYPDFQHYDTLFTTVVSLDTIQKHTWHVVRRENMILRRDTIPLSEAYLKSIKYKIEYK
ncbi:hypothetical protein [Dysgonomonas sp. 25]|uniref:hypothetical protein n=1 Tax=Dysgonomonas sp. 25 TaxID=2302933 RepID=UPI0013D5DBFA|nr:hypothetical protein [Dysgonomonas sp. 25]NDV69243.1 hypothetical protein [Dysgonomonas sp. 25]